MSPRRIPLLVLAVVAMLVAACGGGTKPAAGSSASPAAGIRYAQVDVVHATIGGEPRVRLRTVIDGGGEVMTAIGSDTETGENGTLKWTSMRAALLVQLKSAMKALGWQEVGSGPQWWQVRFSGGPEAKIPVVAPDDEADGGTTPAVTPPVTPATTPTQQQDGSTGDVGDLVSMIGKNADDPQVQRLMRVCGAGSDWHRSGNIACEDAGFELTLSGAALVVTQVTLSSGELNGYSEYAGRLPLGLTWNDTYNSILAKLGTPDHQVGGNGVTVTLQYPAGGGWVTLETSATHMWPEQLARAHLIRVNITRQPVYTF